MSLSWRFLFNISILILVFGWNRRRSWMDHTLSERSSREDFTPPGMLVDTGDTIWRGRRVALRVSPMVYSSPAAVPCTEQPLIQLKVPLTTMVKTCWKLMVFRPPLICLWRQKHQACHGLCRYGHLTLGSMVGLVHHIVAGSSIIWIRQTLLTRQTLLNLPGAVSQW